MSGKIKTTNPQRDDEVDKLMKAVFIGNGEPSLYEIVRGTVKDIQSFKDEVFVRLSSLEKKMEERDEAYRKAAEVSAAKEVDFWKDKYDSLTKRHIKEETLERANKTYWMRTIIGLVLSQIVQWGFIWFFRSQ